MATGILRFALFMPEGTTIEQFDSVADELFRSITNRDTFLTAFGTMVFIAVDERSAEEELVPLERIASVTLVRYPFIYVNITYDPSRVTAADFREEQIRFGLVFVGNTVFEGGAFPDR